MRAHHVIAVIVVLVIGLAAKQFFLPAEKVEADTPSTNASMNVLQMQVERPNIKNIPSQKMNDMTFIFPGHE